MPLVGAVLLLIFVYVISKESIKNSTRQQSNYVTAWAKTNIRLERRLCDMYLKQGMTFSEAYIAARTEMIRRGYVPNIPRDAYGINHFYSRHPGADSGYKLETSCIGNVRRFEDSMAVQQRRRLLSKSGQLKNITDDEFYLDWPIGLFCQKQATENARRVESLSLPIGTWITYIKYGKRTLEIVGYDYLHAFKGVAYYKAQFTDTGEIVDIRIDYGGIRKIG
jgi:hypothetical protein